MNKSNKLPTYINFEDKACVVHLMDKRYKGRIFSTNEVMYSYNPSNVVLWVQRKLCEQPTLQNRVLTTAQGV